MESFSYEAQAVKNYALRIDVKPLPQPHIIFDIVTSASVMANIKVRKLHDKSVASHGSVFTFETRLELSLETGILAMVCSLCPILKSHCRFNSLCG